MVEVVQRDDQANVVLADERGQSRHVAGTRNARHDGHPIGVVERGSEGVRIGAERGRPGRPECPHDVDALARAREQDDHERGEYSWKHGR